MWAQGIQISWTLCHYGWPDDVSLFDQDFISRFATFCGALSRFLAPWYRAAPVYSPMNEISFFSWGISVGLFACDDCPEPDPADVAKRQLVRATLAGVDLLGICLYPILDRPLWEKTTFWSRSGLWDLDRLGPDPCARQLQQPYADALH